jgi:hypothetical protein
MRRALIDDWIVGMFVVVIADAAIKNMAASFGKIDTRKFCLFDQIPLFSQHSRCLYTIYPVYKTEKL